MTWFNNKSVLSEPLVRAKTTTKKKPTFLWTAKDKTKQIVILDPIPVARLSFHVDSKNNYEKVPCIAQHDNCPLCESAQVKNSRFGKARPYILVTVLDLDPWTTKEGKVVPYTKKIFAIETEAQRKVIGKYFEKYGTTRGMVLELARSGQKGEGACGVAMFEEMLSEDDLRKRFNNPEYKAEDGRVLKKAGADLEVFDYEALFTLPTAQELRSTYNMASPLGANDTFSMNDEEPPFDLDEEFDPDDYDTVQD